MVVDFFTQYIYYYMNSFRNIIGNEFRKKEKNVTLSKSSGDEIFFFVMLARGTKKEKHGVLIVIF